LDGVADLETPVSTIEQYQIAVYVCRVTLVRDVPMGTVMIALPRGWVSQQQEK